jgi:uncharacterized protein (TIGR03086 family)
MSETRQRLLSVAAMLSHVVNFSDGLMERFALSSSEFERRLLAVRPEQWAWATPCTGWDVRQLVNHMTGGNLNYVGLLGGATGADFLRRRDIDALGTDPVRAYTRSVHECAAAFAQTGALQRLLDYPLGPLTGQQALAVRTTDTTIHTWDLARAIGADEALDASLVTWIDDHLDEIYAGLAETPISADTTHRFFAAPSNPPARPMSRQHRLLHRMGRNAAAG